MISVDDFLSALESALEGVMGDEVEIDSDEMADEEPGIEDEEAADMDMGAADVDMDMAVDDEEMLEETGAKDDGESKGDDSVEKDYEKNESTKANDDLVEAVTKRVAARILKSALAKK